MKKFVNFVKKYKNERLKLNSFVPKFLFSNGEFWFCGFSGCYISRPVTPICIVFGCEGVRGVGEL